MKVHYACINKSQVVYHFPDELISFVYQAASRSNSQESFDRYLCKLVNALTNYLSSKQPILGTPRHIVYPDALYNADAVTRDDYAKLDITVWGGWRWDKPFGETKTPLRLAKGLELTETQLNLYKAARSLQADKNQKLHAALKKSTGYMAAFLTISAALWDSYKRTGKIDTERVKLLEEISIAYVKSSGDCGAAIQSAMAKFDSKDNQMIAAANEALQAVNDFGVLCEQVVYVATVQADKGGKK